MARYRIFADTHGYMILTNGYQILADTLQEAIRAKRRLIQMDKERKNNP